MMKALVALFGEGSDLDVLQMSMRALVTFFVALALIRLSGRRSFGQRSPFDSVVVILLGATLSRAIVGASPFGATIAAAFVIVALHRSLAWASMHSPWLERLVGGVEREVFSNGQFHRREMNAALVSTTDIRESVRQKTGSRSMEQVAAAILERNGEVSVIHKKA